MQSGTYGHTASILRYLRMGTSLRILWTSTLLLSPSPKTWSITIPMVGHNTKQFGHHSSGCDGFPRAWQTAPMLHHSNLCRLMILAPKMRMTAIQDFKVAVVRHHPCSLYPCQQWNQQWSGSAGHARVLILIASPIITSVAAYQGRLNPLLPRHRQIPLHHCQRPHLLWPALMKTLSSMKNGTHTLRQGHTHIIHHRCLYMYL